jgi:dTDP-D-glucose 4,6-dehydratase
MATPEYKPTAILLTGGAGFIGSHVAIRLIKSYPDVKVVVFDSMEYCASMNNLSSVKGMSNFKVGGLLRIGDSAHVAQQAGPVCCHAIVSSPNQPIRAPAVRQG